MYLCLKYILFIAMTVSVWACEKKAETEPEVAEELGLSYIRLGQKSIVGGGEVSIADAIVIGFDQEVWPTNNSHFTLEENGVEKSIELAQGQNKREIICSATDEFKEGHSYRFLIHSTLRSLEGAGFKGGGYSFTISVEPLKLLTASSNGLVLDMRKQNKDISLSLDLQLEFSHPLSLENFKNNIHLEDGGELTVEQESENAFLVKTTDPLDYWKKVSLVIDEGLGAEVHRPFEEVKLDCFTALDSTDKFPRITDEALLNKVQQHSFEYFWSFGHPVSGMARERNTSNDIVTTGGTGFGLMAMIVAIERGFISREKGIQRWEKIVNFLETADRFHGAWPHWLNGNTGKVQPFSQQDNGGDLVETAFLMQGLLTVQAYLKNEVPSETELMAKIQGLWEEVEWDWYTKGGTNTLYWHWSPDGEWAINLPISGHNETQIVYVLAAASPTHSIAKSVYENGYKRNGAYRNGQNYGNITLPLGNDQGGPLFFAHYSYLGLDPRNLKEDNVSYWDQNRSHTLINRAYCIDNPRQYVGYSGDCWGLTASDNQEGYSAHSPNNDLGVITATAALSSFPYTPEESMAALHFFYYKIGDRIWGEYGFYDAFNPDMEWYADSYLAIDQGPIVVMIENYRSQLLWNLFMSNVEIQKGLEKLEILF
ncbi:glucoamylase family protein [Membranihabitans marinus]|uniref:glucoamylase family protein n=1 Tax=Membranihabitans marinus TaxID=1227546 RepID=UPI001F3A734E|nr:glucoamylase family protein [Membranihabitans marinus]